MKTKQDNNIYERRFWKDEGGSEMWKRQEGVSSGSQVRKELGEGKGQ